VLLLAWASIAVGIVSAIAVALDERTHPQPMWIMNLVWPITALYGGFLGLWGYYRLGRPRPAAGAGPPRGRDKPFWQIAAVATTHCGAGCALGDLIAEWTLVVFPMTLFGRRIFAAWVLDFLLAFLLGIAFQYFTITPMRHLSPRAGLVAALKADALSLTAWQVGMYGWMALVTFAILGRELPPTTAVFWLMMQCGMIAGFLVSYPVNWWLVRSGLKERM
jgi:Domain of unknown function (DUF4396)